MRAEIQQQMRTDEGGQKGKQHHPQHTNTQYGEEILVTVWDHTIYQHAGQQRHGEGEQLQEEREDTNAPEEPRMSHYGLHIPPHHVTAVRFRLEVIGGLKDQGHTRKRAAKLLHWDPAPSIR